VSLVPLAAVCWADGCLEDKERRAILKAAAARGVAPGSPHYAMLEAWLKEKPSPQLMEAWKKYARGIWEQLPDDERTVMRRALWEGPGRSPRRPGLPGAQVRLRRGEGRAGGAGAVLS